MSPASAKPARSARAANAAIESQTEFLFGNEMFWAPARAAANILLRAQKNAVAMMQINRKLADELRGIMRHEQDVMCEVSERMFKRMTSGAIRSEETGSAEPFGQLYETAVEGVREFNEAVAEAQTRSIAAFREHAQAAADVSTQTVEDEAA